MSDLTIVKNRYKYFTETTNKYHNYLLMKKYEKSVYTKYVFYAKQLFVSMKNNKLTKIDIDRFVEKNEFFNVKDINELDLFIKDLIEFFKGENLTRKDFSYEYEKLKVPGRVTNKTTVNKLLNNYKVFNQLMEQYKVYLLLQGQNKNTYNSYLSHAKRFLITLDSTILNQKLVSDYVMANRDYSVSTINQRSSVLNSVIECFKELTQFDKSVQGYKLCSAKNTHRKLPNVISEKRIQEILDHLKAIRKDWQSYRDYAIWIFLYATGVRVSELINIAPSDIQEEQWVRINSGKGSKDRIVPIAYKAIVAIKEYRDICPLNTNKSLFVNYMGKALSRVSIFKTTKKLDDINPHALRHSYATHMYNNGMDLMVLSQLLGHANIETTEIYLHTQNEQLKECIKKHHPINKLYQFKSSQSLNKSNQSLSYRLPL